MSMAERETARLIESGDNLLLARAALDIDIKQARDGLVGRSVNVEGLSTWSDELSNGYESPISTAAQTVFDEYNNEVIAVDPSDDRWSSAVSLLTGLSLAGPMLYAPRTIAGVDRRESLGLLRQKAYKGYGKVLGWLMDLDEAADGDLNKGARNDRMARLMVSALLNRGDEPEGAYSIAIPGRAVKQTRQCIDAEVFSLRRHWGIHPTKNFIDIQTLQNKRARPDRIHMSAIDIFGKNANEYRTLAKLIASDAADQEAATNSSILDEYSQRVANLFWNGIGTPAVYLDVPSLKSSSIGPRV